MLLKEMFSPIGAPKEVEDDIDWIDDLKFFIDSDDDILSQYFFPAIKKHKEYQKHPQVFKLYIKPIQSAADHYCSKFDIQDRSEKFPKEKLIDLAKRFAEEQEKHMDKGDYE